MFVNNENNNYGATASATAAIFAVVVSGDKQTQCPMKMNTRTRADAW